MSDPAVTFLLENVKDLLKHHINLISGAEGELRNLQNELGEMRAYLKDASQKLYKEEHFKEWEKNLRAVVYEVEEAIDSCITQAAIEKKRNIIVRTFNPKRIGLAEKIKSLREDKVRNVLNKATIEKANLNIVDESDRNREEMMDRKKTPRQGNVIGFEDQTTTLVGHLLEKSKGLEVISISGMPGLGKTTLAWKIYCDSRIEEEFPILIWVVVSQKFNKKDVLLTILRKFTNEDMSSKSDDVLKILVGDYLERSKFLIFLDDVWTMEAWKQIHDFLPKNNSMGRVLMTTRIDGVSWNANHIREPHKLRFLNDEESWMLLKLEVFDNLDDFPRELEEFGMHIAKRCCGLPLAIIVMGGILVNKLSMAGGIARRKNEWEKISQNTDMFYGITGDNHNHMDKIISLSYTNLPYDLRDCFLYVGIFPEDSEIQAWELTQLWIAEGFIKQKPNGESLEETAHDNLNDLINRNLVMVDKIKPNGEVKTCRVHDTIRDFCKNEAAFGKQNLFQEVRNSSEGVFVPHVKDIQKCHRLCIHSFVKDFFLKKTKLSQTRSFLSYTRPIDLEKKDIPSITDVFELLRVFNAKTVKFPKFPAKINNLVLLRYITLGGDQIQILPKAISKLYNLQTFTVATLKPTLKIKGNIWHMMQLRHVKTNASIILRKNVKGDGGENLRTLSKLSPRSCTKEVFVKAKNLKTLGIRGELATLLDSKCLEELGHLEKLKLVNHLYLKKESENPLPRLPCTFPINLRFLTLSTTYLDWSHMDNTVGMIPNLEVLKLKDNAFNGDSWDSVAGGFDKLDYLYMDHSNLMLWRINAGDDPFPKLKTIVLKNCKELQSVPKDLVRKLDKLDMQCVTRFAVKSAKEVEVERRNIEEQQQIIRGGFKLIIAPEDEQKFQNPS